MLTVLDGSSTLLEVNHLACLVSLANMNALCVTFAAGLSFTMYNFALNLAAFHTTGHCALHGCCIPTAAAVHCWQSNAFHKVR